MALLANDLLGNNIDFGAFVLSSGLPHIRSGKVIALGATEVRRFAGTGLRPQRDQLTLPLCNLAAVDQFDPTNHDVSRFVDEDMNRQWQVDRMASGRTLERRRAVALRPFVERADWLLDLHSMHEPPLLPAGIQPHNLEFARFLCASKHVVVDAGHGDGVRMRDFGRFGEMNPEGGDAATCSLLLECGFHGDLNNRVVAQDMCVRFLQAAVRWTQRSCNAPRRAGSKVTCRASG